MLPILNKCGHAFVGPFYIFSYLVTTSFTGRLEHVNKEVLWDLDHLLSLNEARIALGCEPLEEDSYLKVRR